MICNVLCCPHPTAFCDLHQVIESQMILEYPISVMDIGTQATMNFLFSLNNYYNIKGNKRFINRFLIKCNFVCTIAKS